MRTWKPFTDTPARGARAAASLLLATLLAACAAVPTGELPVAGPPGGGEAREPAAVVPVPEVDGRVAAEFEEAVRLLREERFSDAEVLLRSITREAPELAGPWINLGQVYVALGQPEEARRAFEAGAAANPYNCTAHNELGLLARVQGDFDAAERHYLNCLQRVPDNGAAHLNLGILYELYLGRLSDALANYRSYQALLAEPDRRVKGWVMDLERRLGV